MSGCLKIMNDLARLPVDGRSYIGDREVYTICIISDVSFVIANQRSVGYACIMLVVETDPFDRLLPPFGARQSGLR